MPWLSSLIRRRRSNEPDALLDHVEAAKRIRGMNFTTPITTLDSRRPLTPPGSSSVARPQLQSPFLALPTELRLKIWTLVAGYSRSITLGCGTSSNSKMSREPPSRSFPVDKGDVRGWETALLYTCKQVYAEVLPVLM